MKVIVLVKANKESESGALPGKELLTDMGKFNEELVKAGIMLAAEGLKASSKGVRVKFSEDTQTVTRGPFPETGELVAGFWLWKVKSMEEAVEWLRRAPFKEAEIEIRPVHEAEDFGANLTPEAKERQERLQLEMERQKAS
jgi:hypothetical protein